MLTTQMTYLSGVKRERIHNAAFNRCFTSKKKRKQQMSDKEEEYNNDYTIKKLNQIRF